MSRHTPGPWKNHGRQPGAPGLPCSAVAADTLLARVYSRAFGDTAQETANANLIAASPDLLAACKLAREALSAMLTHMGMDEDEWNKPTFDQARDAIKALGAAIGKAEAS